LQAEILRALLVDGRKSFTKIAKGIGAPKEEVYKNYREMKTAGIIKGATIHINYRNFGYQTVGHILINIEPSESDRLLEYIERMPETYSVHDSCSPKGTIRIVTILRTLRELEDIKERLTSQFSIINLKTSIWTDVREMHGNLEIIPQGQKVAIDAEVPMEGYCGSAVRDKVVKISEADLRISEKLAANGRAPFIKIAQELGLSLDKVKRRYEKLKTDGSIKVTIQIDPTKIGYHAMLVIYVTINSQDTLQIIEEIGKIPDIISIMKTSGDYDLQVYAMLRDLQDLFRVRDKIGRIPGIAQMNLEVSRMPNKWPTPRQYISTF
jgi:DNA-binding Lrp family transcriptional regulator